MFFVFLFLGFFCFSAGAIAREREAVVALHDAVEDGVGNGGVADPGMPVFDG